MKYFNLCHRSSQIIVHLYGSIAALLGFATWSVIHDRLYGLPGDGTSSIEDRYDVMAKECLCSSLALLSNRVHCPDCGRAWGLNDWIACLQYTQWCCGACMAHCMEWETFQNLSLDHPTCGGYYYLFNVLSLCWMTEVQNVWIQRRKMSDIVSSVNNGGLLGWGRRRGLQLGSLWIIRICGGILLWWWSFIGLVDLW